MYFTKKFQCGFFPYSVARKITRFKPYEFRNFPKFFTCEGLVCWEFGNEKHKYS